MGHVFDAWVEVRHISDWRDIIHAGSLLDQDLNAFGALFGGPTNYSDCEPLAASRGFPDDASRQLRREHDRQAEAASNASWATWAELQAMLEDPRVFPFEARADVEWRHADGSLISRFENTNWSASARAAVPGSSSWEDDEYVYVRQADADPDNQTRLTTVQHTFRKIRRRDLYGGRWRVLFELMALLAIEYGASNVRLVGWLI
jgi:hypothetical protein